MSDEFGIPEVDMRPAYEVINDLRIQLAANALHGMNREAWVIQLEEKLESRDAEVAELNLRYEKLLNIAALRETEQQVQIEQLRNQMTLLLDALEWYGEEAKAISRNIKSKNDMAVLASVNVLALDAGKRAALASTEPKP